METVLGSLKARNQQARPGETSDATFVQEPAIVKRLQELGAVAATINTPQQFDAWIRRDYEKWRRVVKETGIKIAK